MDQLLPQLHQAQARGIAPLVICPTPYNAEDVPLVVHPQGLRLRQTLGHGFTLIVDGREALMAEVSHSVGQQAGGDAETTLLIQHLMQAYRRARPLKGGVIP